MESTIKPVDTITLRAPGVILKEVPGAFYVTDVKEHLEIKKPILDAINRMGVHSMIEPNQELCNTDWHLNTNFSRPYWNIVAPYCVEHLSKISTHLGFNSVSVANYWFQQYAQGDFHDWHGHASVMFSSVYFVNLPTKELQTTFKFNGVEFQVNVSEGQILTFPSCYLHKSSPNTTDTIKTVVVFNSNMHMG